MENEELPELPRVDHEGQAADAIYARITELARDAEPEQLLDLSYAHAYATYGRTGGREIRTDIEIREN